VQLAHPSPQGTQVTYAAPAVDDVLVPVAAIVTFTYCAPQVIVVGLVGWHRLDAVRLNPLLQVKQIYTF
jgi:hypothetical protein